MPFAVGSGSTGQWRRACATADVLDGDPVRIAWKPPIAIDCSEGRYFAIADKCTHEDFPLSDGFVRGRQLECAYHGVTYDLETGESDSILANGPVKTYEVKVEDDAVLVRWPED